MDQMTKKDDLGKAVATKNAAVESTVSGLFSGMPTKPIPSAIAGTFADVVGDALKTLGGGQVDIPVEPVAGDLTEYPPKLALGVAALQRAFDTVKSGEPYRFAVDDLVDERGVMEVTNKIASATADQALAREMLAFTPSSGSSNTQLGKTKAEKKKRTDLAFTGDTTNDNRKVAFTGDTTNDNRKV